MPDFRTAPVTEPATPATGTPDAEAAAIVAARRSGAWLVADEIARETRLRTAVAAIRVEVPDVTAHDLRDALNALDA